MADRFDKFTDRARRALQTAQEEAVRLGRGEIVAEHLLVGLLADRTSVAAHALERLGVDLDELADKAAGEGPSHDPPQPQIGLAASAKQAIELAVDEARALDHHYVGTEHLLLGLLRQGANPAADALRTRGITLQAARGAVVAILNSAPPAPGARPVRRPTPTPVSSEEVELLFAQLSTYLADPSNRPPEPEGELLGRLSDEALTVLGFAVDEARRLNHNYVGTEHVLLGLVRDPNIPVGRLLVDQGVRLTNVRDAVELIIGRGDRTAGEPGFTPRARKVILLGIDEARSLGDPAMGAEHLLLGIVREGEGIASSVLESILVNPDKIRSQVLEALGQPVPEAPGPFRTEHLTRLARKALLQAQLAARWYYHPQVSTEHLLLGLVRERASAAAGALGDLGADLARVLEQFEALTSEPSGRPTPDRVEYTSAARAAIDHASRAAAERGHPQAGTGHLLLGVLSVPDGHAHTLLQRLGIATDQARQAAEARLTDPED